MNIPKRTRGHQSVSATAKYNQEMINFSNDMKHFQKGVDFKISARGWCYQLEGFNNAIDKSQFNDAEKVINECRKTGLLPLNFTADDEKRMPSFVAKNDGDIDHTLKSWRNSMIFSTTKYKPTLLSEHTGTHIEVFVEKKDLVGLFSKVCKKYQIAISNGGGWSDINSRAKLVERCYDAHEKGQDVHILYCGDFDPAGLLIGDTFKKNLKDLEEAMGIDTSFININVFGLSYEYIQDNDLVWTDNLMTGSKTKDAKPLDHPEHPDHYKDYVQDYINAYGVRKVEANALLGDIEAARQMLENVINTYITLEQLDDYENSLIQSRDDLLVEMKKVWIKKEKFDTKLNKAKTKAKIKLNKAKTKAEIKLRADLDIEANEVLEDNMYAWQSHIEQLLWVHHPEVNLDELLKTTKSVFKPKTLKK